MDFDVNNPELALFSIDGVPMEQMSVASGEVEPCSRKNVAINNDESLLSTGKKRERETKLELMEVDSKPQTPQPQPHPEIEIPKSDLVPSEGRRSKSPKLEQNTPIAKVSSPKKNVPSSPQKSPIQLSDSQTLEMDYSLWSLEAQANHKRRGRPRKSAPMKEIADVIPDTSIYDSVKKIPCFVSGCTHAYHRPGSSVIERSDRMLVLGNAYDGFTIRTCKKHHEIWKRLTSQAGNTCEICRGLNCNKEDLFQKKNFASTEGKNFCICDKCARRQSVVLKLPSNADAGAMDH